MTLFDYPHSESKNLLPKDGTVHYFGKIVEQNLAQNYFETLLKTILWENDKAIIFGKTIITKRKVAWYAAAEFEYTYSKTTKKALLWTKELEEIKNIVEQKTNETYNSCLLNLYHTGEEGMAWHSDAEKEMKKNGAIASISLGAERKFIFKHKQTGETINIFLENGSLLLMKDQTQSFWLHRLPPSTKIVKPRINLTFRTIIEQNSKS